MRRWYGLIPSGVLGAWLVATSMAAAEEATLGTPSPKAQQALQLLPSEDPYQRQLGFLRLEALRELSTVPALQAYTTDRDPETRAYSLRAVAAIQGAGAVAQLLAVLRRDRHPRVRRAALLGLEPLQAADAAILPAFLEALRDRDTTVRMTAVDIVSRIDDPRAADAIRQRAKRERRRDVRRVLTAAMRRIDPSTHPSPSLGTRSGFRPTSPSSSEEATGLHERHAR